MKNSKIEWTDHTFNPWWGCAEVPGHPGCAHCYAKAWAARTGRVKWGRGENRLLMSDFYWNEPLRWNEQAKKDGIRPRVFCASMADVFDAEVPDEWRHRLFGLIALCDQLDWLILTKRPALARDYFKEITNAAFAEGDAQNLYHKRTGKDPSLWLAVHFPLPNVIIGTSVSDQKTADEYIPLLLQVPAERRMISYEPALGPVDFDHWILGRCNACDETYYGWQRWLDPTTKEVSEAPTGLSECGHCGREFPDDQRSECYTKPIDWIIVGGESGPKARPFNIEWARETIAQCKDAGVPCFVKQLGSAPYEAYFGAAPQAELKVFTKPADPKGGDPAEWPEDLRVREFYEPLEIDKSQIPNLQSPRVAVDKK